MAYGLIAVLYANMIDEDEGMINKISLQKSPEKLEKDLLRYTQMALERGASAACIITTEQIIFDERVRLKCRFPLCRHYGACFNCPPYTGTVEEMRAQANLFRHAIVFKANFPSDSMVTRDKKSKQSLEDRRLINDIASIIESAAFYDGYYFATGFSDGSCKLYLCGELSCQALKGGGCRQQAFARASMEAVGIDVYRLATLLGWDVYPIGRSIQVDMVPHGLRVGLVLIT